MRPSSGVSRPAMAASVVDFPEPEGPNRMVMPGSARKATSTLNSRSRDRVSLRRTSSASGIAHPRQAIDQIQRHDGDAGEDGHHAGGGALVVLLDGVVDGQRRGLRLAGNVARDHERDAEVAESA